MVIAKTVVKSIRSPRGKSGAGSVHIEAFGATDVGLLRQSNEDTFGYDSELGLFVVCDGMGGHAAGEIAASIAVDAILDEFTKRHQVTPMAANDPEGAIPVIQQSALRSAVRRAHNAITDAQCRNADYAGMGTTLAAMKVSDGHATIAHVGDSRVYRWRRDSGLTRETRDHSLYNQMVDEGRIPNGLTEQEFPQRNVIMRALGARDHRAEIRTLPKSPGDVFLMCSDGLTDMVDDDELERIMDWYEGAPENSAKALIAAAIEAGGRDNITVLVIRCGAEGLSDKHGEDEVETERDLELPIDPEDLLDTLREQHPGRDFSQRIVGGTSRRRDWR